MRKSRIEAAETRQRIIEVAARKFRLNGITATGLADIMSEAGLTQGGFYRHFESKNQLVAEACAAATETIVATLEEAAGKSDDKDGFRAIVESYVSTNHRDNAAGGCPLAGMGTELAHSDDNTRAVASEGFRQLVEVVEKQLGQQQADSTESKAVFAVAAMIGAVMLARIMKDGSASDSVLDHVKHHLSTI